MAISGDTIVAGAYGDDEPYDSGAAYVFSSPDVAIVKSVDTGGLDPVELSGVVTYTIVISNSGGGIAMNVVLTDPLPSAVSFITQSEGTLLVPQPLDNTIYQWGPWDVAAQTAYTITFTANVTGNVAFAGQIITNSAYFGAANHAPGASNPVTFTIAHPGANTPPTISDIANQSTEVSTPLSVTFIISDAETALDALALSRASSDTALLKVDDITLEGSGGDCTATITPTTGMMGTVVITITVDDGKLEDSASFVLAVGVNAPPEFASTPVETATVGVTYVYTATATDPDAGDTLAITATTAPAWLTLSDHGDGSATLTGIPMTADAYAVVLQVSDGQAQATQSFTITVEEPPQYFIYLPLVLKG